jgi:hypothetical protein
MGASTDDVCTLSTLDGVVWIMDSTADAIPPGMVRTFRRFGHGGYYTKDDLYGNIGQS